jgi:hypothetical protein
MDEANNPEDGHGDDNHGGGLGENNGEHENVQNGQTGGGARGITNQLMAALLGILCLVVLLVLFSLHLLKL